MLSQRAVKPKTTNQPTSPLFPSLWDTARYRLKYYLKGPLNPKQPTNQINTFGHLYSFSYFPTPLPSSSPFASCLSSLKSRSLSKISSWLSISSALARNERHNSYAGPRSAVGRARWSDDATGKFQCRGVLV